MGIVATSLMTFEEFERLPEHEGVGKLELLEGEVFRLPIPELVHSLLAHKIFGPLHGAETSGVCWELGSVFMGVGYKLPGHSFVRPDVSVTHAAQTHAKYLHDAPALAVEVIAPRNTAREMEKKLALYFQHGAREVWRVYRNPLHIVVHLPDRTSRTVLAGSLTTPLLPSFELRLADLEALIKRS